MPREMPADLLVEKHVLGAALMFPECLSQAVETMSAEDFYSPRHQVIFRGMGALQSAGVEFGMVGLSHVLEGSGSLQAAGGDDYLMAVCTEAVSDVGFSHHIQIVKDMAARRRLITAHLQSLEVAFDASKPYQEAQEHAESAILSVGESRKSGPKMRTMKQVIASAAREWQAVAEGKPGGLMSKIAPVDNLTLGLRPGKMYILAARPGLGKSMLALQTATQCGAPVAIYSLEMLAEEQAERMVSQECDLNSDSLRSANVLLAKGKVLAGVVAKLAGLPIAWCDEAVTVPQILSQCRRLKRQGGLGLIVVDYMQLIKSIGKHERRDLEVGAVSKGLKAIAMKLGIPVLVIASLSRKPEERTDKRPMLSDLRESGDIESDADGVMFLYRHSDYNPEAKRRFPNVTELILAKNRGGKKGRALMEFDGAHSKFYPLHPHAETDYLNFIEGKNDQEAKPRHPSQVSGNYSDSFFQG